jgi:hypothetical protein
VKSGLKRTKKNPVTTSDKRKVLQMADAFSYNVRGFKATWRDLMELFEILDHTAMTTTSHLYIHHHSGSVVRRQEN